MTNEAPGATPMANATAKVNSIGTSKTLSAPKPARVDMSAHVGLRGVLAVHVLLFHLTFFSHWQWDTQGSVALPFFLMLSGFTMAVVYGGRGIVDEETTVCCWRTGVNLFGDGGHQEGELHPAGTGKPMQLWGWWQNRLARVLPVYYLTSLPGIPLSWLGYGQMWFTPWQMTTTLVGNAALATTVSGFYLGSPLNGPAWTLSTLAVFWAAFPAMLSRAQRVPTPALLTSIVWWFWAQAIIGLGLFAVAVAADLVLPFQIATMHPLSRLPLFWMGVAAGTLRTRVTKSGGLQWFRSPCTHCAGCRPCKADATETQVLKGAEQWGAQVSWHSAVFTGVLVTCALLEAAGVMVLAALWAQMLLTLSSLIILMGLTLDEGSTVCSRVLRHPLSQWLGGLSFSLYLVHFPFIDAAAFLLRGPVSRPPGWSITTCATETGEASGPAWQACEDLRATYFKTHRILPVWILPAVAAVGVVVTLLVNKYVEGPCRDAWRVRAAAKPAASAPADRSAPQKPRRRSVGHKGKTE